MSGRLVLLPHKSWNVWNQDNRERVLRDERLHREQEEEKRKLAQQRERERTHNKLSEDGQADEAKSVPERFCLFDEPVSVVSHQHPEFMREEAEKEQRKRKREGVADWALGKGDFVSNASSLWYNKASREPAAIPQEALRSLDPMNRYQLDRHEVIESKEASEQEAPFVPQLDDGERELKAKKQKKDKSKKKDKRGKKHEHRAKDADLSEEEGGRDDCSARNPSGKGKERKGLSLMEELRQKRLQREKVEHQKETRLLAQSDIFGPQAVTEGRYNSQFHPQLARPR